MAFSILLKPALAVLAFVIGHYAYDFSAARVLLCFVLAYCVRITYWQLTTGTSRRRLTRQHDCRPVYRWPAKDPIFGIDSLLESLAAVKQVGNFGASIIPSGSLPNKGSTSTRYYGGKVAHVFVLFVTARSNADSGICHSTVLLNTRNTASTPKIRGPAPSSF